MFVDACVQRPQPLVWILGCRACERGDAAERMKFGLKRITPGQGLIRRVGIDLG